MTSSEITYIVAFVGSIPRVNLAEELYLITYDTFAVNVVFDTVNVTIKEDNLGVTI